MINCYGWCITNIILLITNIYIYIKFYCLPLILSTCQFSSCAKTKQKQKQKQDLSYNLNLPSVAQRILGPNAKIKMRPLIYLNIFNIT